MILPGFMTTMRSYEKEAMPSAKKFSQTGPSVYRISYMRNKRFSRILFSFTPVVTEQKMGTLASSSWIFSAHFSHKN